MTDLISWDYAKNKGIVWCIPVDKKDKGFLVRQGQEVALWFQKGRLLEVILDGYSYEFKKSEEKENSELIYVKSGDIRILWGIPIRNGIISADQIMFGCHGVMTLKVISPQDFVFNLVSTCTCLFIEDIEKEVYLHGEKRKEEILKKGVENEEIRVQDARRIDEPYLFTQEDLKNWVLPVLRQVLREKFAELELAEISKIPGKDLEKEVRILMNKELAKWGLELSSINMLGWNLPTK